MKLKALTPSLKTRDIRGTIDFYVKVLGFTIDTLWPADNPTLCILDRDGVHLSFAVDTEGWYADKPCLTGQLWIDVEDVIALHARVAGSVAIEWGPEVYHYGRREFAIKDPNGYLLAFSERTTDPTNR